MARDRDPYMSAATAAFVLLGAGYLLREQGLFGPGISLFLGVLPNLAGCAAVPLIVAPLLRKRPNGPLSTKGTSALLGAAAALIGATLIEAAHVVFNLGFFDLNDMVASVIGTGLGVALLFAIDRRSVGAEPAPFVVRGDA